MFHTGGLQSGIGLALQTSKEVAVFACASNEDPTYPASQQWEDVAFSHTKVAEYLASNAVLLKIQQGSLEFTQFQAFVPSVTCPSVILIRNGQVTRTFNDPQELIQEAESPSAAPNPTPTTSSNSQNTSSPPPPQPGARPIPPSAIAQAATPAAPQPLPASVPPSSNRSPPPPQTTSPQQPPTRSQPTQDWAAQQRARNLKAREERDRILAQIERDKKARAAAAAERKRLASGDQTSPNTTSSSTTGPSRALRGSSAHIQTRLLSGRTIRSSLPATASISKDLRPSIDEALAADDEGRVPAYKLAVIGIPPQTAREIALGEEGQTVADLGLMPSATIVVVRVAGAVDAYAGAGSGIVGTVLGVPGRLIGGAFGVVGAVGGAVTGALGSVLGVAGAASGPTRNTESPDGGEQQNQRGVNIGTVGAMRADSEREERQLYNGNQSNVQDNNEDK
ncbi:hypothetical protein BT63DRAFT_474778 [Microthyrium microscopicum]|uniref:UBX domain-containing protein n=1 Tax=Microthyrium microscopicum TaxID=703497 RepID=A0A6A6US18_9PEZI|nr:hypothetical protein BT63DRAFT_474778 [Microthyrium microscopicum]